MLTSFYSQLLTLFLCNCFLAQRKNVCPLRAPKVYSNKSYLETISSSILTYDIPQRWSSWVRPHCPYTFSLLLNVFNLPFQSIQEYPTNLYFCILRSFIMQQSTASQQFSWVFQNCYNERIQMRKQTLTHNYTGDIAKATQQNYLWQIWPKISRFQLCYCFPGAENHLVDPPCRLPKKWNEYSN